MEYDKRIDDRAMILNCLDVGFCKRNKFSSGYFTDKIRNYSDLSVCKYGKLTDTRNDGVYTYQKDDNDWFAFFLPDCAVIKEKRYRPCTLDNFGLYIGDWIKFRKKDDHNFEISTMYLGYKKNNDTIEVLLGNTYYSLEVLFNDYEWYDRDSSTWEIFGVEE